MPERVQLSRRKGWKMPPNTVNVARPGRYGNPFIASETARDGIAAAVMANGMQWLPGDWWTVEETIAMFRQWIAGDPVIDPATGRTMKPPGIFAKPPSIEPLRGKNLACWCKPGAPCHADVLLKFANSPPTQRGSE